MSIQGWIVDLSSHSYRTPGQCASCMGPRETEVKATVSEKSGNIRTTLTMGFPYCNACAKRAGWEKVRQIIVGLLAAGLGAGLAVGAWALDVGLNPGVRFAAALPVAAGLGLGAALLTRQSKPAPPATARGEAVILRNTSGTVLCTNEQFANLLAQANGRQAKPGSMWMTPEAWAPLTALLCGVLVLLMWVRAGSPGMDSSADSRPPPAAQPANGGPNNAGPGNAAQNAAGQQNPGGQKKPAPPPPPAHGAAPAPKGH